MNIAWLFVSPGRNDLQQLIREAGDVYVWSPAARRELKGRRNVENLDHSSGGRNGGREITASGKRRRIVWRQTVGIWRRGLRRPPGNESNQRPAARAFRIDRGSRPLADDCIGSMVTKV